MRKGKRILALSFIVMIVLTAGSSICYGADIEEPRVELGHNSMFIKQIDAIFQGAGHVQRADGKDATELFLQANRCFYEAGDYSSIASYCLLNDITELYSHTRQVRREYDESGTRTILVFYYDETQAHLKEQTGTPHNGKKWYFAVNASGSYRYQDSYGGYIISFPSPTISWFFEDLGAAFTGNVTSVRVSTPVIYSNPVHATFTVTTKHTVTCPIPGFSNLTGTLGPFTDQFSFDISPN